MSKGGTLLIIEHDPEDEEILDDVLVSSFQLKNKIEWFELYKDAFEYLKTTADKLFLIFCDINLSRQNGIDFEKDIDKDKELRRKSILNMTSHQ